MRIGDLVTRSSAHMITLSDLHRGDLEQIFALASRFEEGTGPRFDAAAAMFFPPSSLRTRFSFERGAFEMGIQSIVFPPETLDKDEDHSDIVRYLAQWADIAVIRHPKIDVLRGLAAPDVIPIVNAMTNDNHPCEVLSDLYALSLVADIARLRFLFIGGDGNIARAWWEAARAFGLDIRQSGPASLRVDGMPWEEDVRTAITTADVVLTDGPGEHEAELVPYRVTAELLELAPEGVRFAPCPPFVRGREFDADAVAHPAFVGHAFKRFLKPVQQAVMARALGAVP